MAHITEPRVGETSTTTGTGPFATSAALTAHRRFSDVCSASDTFWGDIEAVDDSGVPSGDWVEGLMTYSAANQVTVTTVYRSSNSNLAVTFGAGTKYVRLIADARQIAATPRAGSSAQILIKQSSTDYDEAWTSVSGDVTITLAGVTAIGSGKVTEAMQVLADNTTGDVSITKHGYAPKAPNDATKFLNGTGAYSTPASGGTPGGSDTQVQFNASNAFSGSSSFTWDNVNKLLKIDGSGGNPAIAFGVGATSSTDPAFRKGSGNTIEGVSSDATQWGTFHTGNFHAEGGVNFQNSAVLANFSSGYTGFYTVGLAAIGGAVVNQVRLVPTGGGTPDVALQYSAAGVAQISDTAGGNANLTLRSLIGTGGLSTGMVAKTADYTVTVNDGDASFDCTGAARTATLPALAGTTTGERHYFWKIDSSGNSLSVDANASETINGSASAISTTTQWGVIGVEVNAAKSNWLRII